jgi:hypothetical protein
MRAIVGSAYAETRATISVTNHRRGRSGIDGHYLCGARGPDVTLIERTRDGGRKILSSGGGCCNVLLAMLGGLVNP